MLTGRVRWPWYVGVSLTYWNLGEICGTYRTQHAAFSLGKTWYLSYGLYGWGRHASTADRHPPGLLLSLLISFHTNKACCSTVAPCDDRESFRPGPRMNEARDDVDTWTWREKGPTNRIIRVGYCTSHSTTCWAKSTYTWLHQHYLSRQANFANFLLIRNAWGTQVAE